MNVTFLLGAAGSGKTWRCLREVRAALAESPEGLPLVFIAPKQATFQLERQILAEGGLAGYSRLQIVSFDRLADFILTQLGESCANLLDEQGRIMVLRALLIRLKDRLKLFHAGARMSGFAGQLSILLREFQCHQITPCHLESLAERPGMPPQLVGKLQDLALLLQEYVRWLAEHNLQDIHHLLALGAETLRNATTQREKPTGAAPLLRLGGVWLDGFAEMTPQELDLLTALVPCCDHATLAFCLEGEPMEETSWLSTWSVVAQTFRACHQRLASFEQCKVAVEVLPRRAVENRFSENPVLGHIEACWTYPQPFGGVADEAVSPPLRIVACANPEAEATLAARQILKHVQAGGRYRDVAVLVRSLEGFHDELRRVFTRFDIPFFLDRREPVSHHSLAELTRYALRVVLHKWRHEDWFGALKTGLIPATETEIDALENNALAYGWEGAAWHNPLKALNIELPPETEELRQRITAPFLEFQSAIIGEGDAARALATGAQISAALRLLWKRLDVQKRLETWIQNGAGLPHASKLNAIHATVWEQMHLWLDSLELAFSEELLPLNEWLMVLESGLNSLTVGVIPPALDQVLIGSVDRSRNPDLRLALVLGVNELSFPTLPPESSLLTEGERETLSQQNCSLGLSYRQKLAHERYYGYIAFTRARCNLVVTYSCADANGKLLNPSLFIARFQQLFPKLEVETYPGFVDVVGTNDATAWTHFLHPSELLGVLARRDWRDAENLPPVLSRIHGRLSAVRDYAATDVLAPVLARALYGREFYGSVSRLEEFAACPFQFFVRSGLGAKERDVFDLDSRQMGSFQHEVLQRFHESVIAEHRQWRDLTAPEASQRVRLIGEELKQTFAGGLLVSDKERDFAANSMIAQLETFIAVTVGWMRETYKFSPVAAELGFGGKNPQLPPWALDLDNGCHLAFVGKIDRVDLLPGDNPGEAYCVVADYKSSEKKIDPMLLENGIDMQLAAYMSVLISQDAAMKHLGISHLIPAGIFYVNLKGKHLSKPNRNAVLGKDSETADPRKAYQHHGRFDFTKTTLLDHGCGGEPSGQFNYRFKKDGTPYAGSAEMMTTDEFQHLFDSVKENLIRMGREIYQGNASVAPYKHKGKVPCDQCPYLGVCRMDRWTHAWRALTAAQP